MSYYELHKEERKQYFREYRKKRKQMMLARRDCLLSKKVLPEKLNITVTKEYLENVIKGNNGLLG